MKIIVKEEGAPAYMAAYTALMTILLAFFVFMSSMSSQQQSGFNKGLGDVQNSFGLEGGLGIFNFTNFGKSGSKIPNPVDKGNKPEEQGVHENLVRSSGGTGNTDVNLMDHEAGKYFRIKIPFTFPELSTKIPDDMAKYLNNVGMGFALFNYKINIRCYAEDSGDENSDRILAAKRAAQIMRYLHQVSDVSYAKMQTSGYSSNRYFTVDESPGKAAENAKQGNYFYIFMNSEQDTKK